MLLITLYYSWIGQSVFYSNLNSSSYKNELNRHNIQNQKSTKTHTKTIGKTMLGTMFLQIKITSRLSTRPKALTLCHLNAASSACTYYDLKLHNERQSVFSQVRFIEWKNSYGLKLNMSVRVHVNNNEKVQIKYF